MTAELDYKELFRKARGLLAEYQCHHMTEEPLDPEFGNRVFDFFKELDQLEAHVAEQNHSDWEPYREEQIPRFQ